MHLFLLGATGRTGKLVVDLALQRGHQVTTVARSPSKLPSHPGLRVIEGDPTQTDVLSSAMRGCDVVITMLGTGGLGRDMLLEDAANSTVLAMKEVGVPRLIVMSTALVFQDVPFVQRMLSRFVLFNVVRNAQAMEAAVAALASGTHIVRPSQLTDGPVTGHYVTELNAMPKGSRPIARAAVAQYLVKEAEEARFTGAVVGLSG